MTTELLPTAGMPAVRQAMRMPRTIRLQSLLPGMALAGVRAAALLAQFGMQLVVAALAGSSGLGMLQVYISWTCIAGEVFSLGLPAHGMRRVAVHYAAGDSTRIVRLLRTAASAIGRAWLAVVLPLSAGAAVLHGMDRLPAAGSYHGILAAVLLSAPLFALLRLYADALKSTGAALAAITLESLVSPLAVLLIAGACWLLGQPVAAATLIAAFAASLLLTPLALRHVLARQLDAAAAPVPERDPAAASGTDQLYLWLVAVLSIVFTQLPFVLLPWFTSAEETGVFAIAHKLVNTITTGLMLLAAVYGPRFARRAARGDVAGLRQLLRQTQLICSGVFLPALLLLLLLANPLAHHLGTEFTDLERYLLILAGGHLVNAATGLSGVLLNMAGAARRELASLVLALAAAVLSSLWVGPHHGATGLAVVFSASITLKNLGSLLLARAFLKTFGDKQ